MTQTISCPACENSNSDLATGEMGQEPVQYDKVDHSNTINSVPEQEPDPSLRKPGFLELCAGSATLSFVAENKGFFAIPVDYSRNKFNPRIPVVKMDLTDRATVDICKELIRSGAVQVVTAAVPCGTASRAREIYMPNGPKPLRSELYPYGLPDLGESDWQRVEIANIIYANVHEILLEADLHHCLCLLENPANSLYYHLDEPKHLLDIGWIDVVFQHCKWTVSKAMRAKWTRIRTNVAELLQLAGECKQNHEHLAWGRKEDGTFHSASEAEYPIEMCVAIMEILVQVLAKRGFFCKVEPIQPTIMDAPSHKRRRMTGGKQPRGNKLPPLISEFKSVTVMKRDGALKMGAKIIKPHSSLFVRQGGEKVTVVSDVLGDLLEHQNDNDSELKPGESLDDNITAGVYRSPEEFIQEALKLVHPTDLPGGVPDELLHSVMDTLRCSPSDIVKSRISAARRLIKLAEDNKARDDKIFSSLETHLKPVLAGKRFGTAQDLVSKWGYRDSSLINDTTRGFDLTGMAPYTEIFDYHIKPQGTTEKALRSRSELHNKAMLSRCKSSGSVEVDQKFWTQTVDECSKGWLTGPFSDLGEVTKLLDGQPPHLTRRFPLEQTTKIRSIDDYLESGINSVFGSHDKLVLFDTDTIASTIRLIERLITGETSEVVLSSKQILKVEVHNEWKGQLDRWSGKTKDLSQAYKQLGISKEARWSSCILVWNPNRKEPAIFLQSTLPFGSSASVLHFNRWARMIWFTGIKEFSLIWTSFFDDFPMLTPSTLQSSSDASANLLVKLLGWRIADGEKEVEWSECFNALGVTFNVERISLAASTVGNKKGRVEALIPVLEDFIKSGKASTKEIESVRGKLQYAEAQVFGRTLKSALSVLNRSRGHGKRFTESEKPKLQWIADWLANSVPRLISPSFKCDPLILFTDGACEGYLEGGEAVTTCGAVLLDRRDGVALTFGFRINKELQDEWIKDGMGKKQLVTEAELLPVLVSRRLWADRLRGAKVFIYVDSNPAKFSLIRGTSESLACENIVRAISISDAASMTWAWYSSVPSKSNVADDPSRLIFPDKIGSFKVRICEAPQPKSLKNGVWID